MSLRFYVKAILGILEVKNLPFFTIPGPEFWFLWFFFTFWRLKINQILLIWWIVAFKKGKNDKKSKLRALKCVKMADFELLESPKLLSRKIWVIEKLWNFHIYTVLKISDTVFYKVFMFLFTLIVVSFNL